MVAFCLTDAQLVPDGVMVVDTCPGNLCDGCYNPKACVCVKRVQHGLRKALNIRVKVPALEQYFLDFQSLTSNRLTEALVGHKILEVRFNVLPVTLKLCIKYVICDLPTRICNMNVLVILLMFELMVIMVAIVFAHVQKVAMNRDVNIRLAIEQHVEDQLEGGTWHVLCWMKCASTSERPDFKAKAHIVSLEKNEAINRFVVPVPVPPQNNVDQNIEDDDNGHNNDDNIV